MGTVASLRLRLDGPTNRGLRDSDIGDVENVFRAYDDAFSLFRPTSELSRIADGSLTLTNSAPTVKQVYAEALSWRNLTAGAFTPHRPDGVLDLSGIVKARAMADAQNLLNRISPAGWLLDVGGDIVTSYTTGEPWRIGIVDPQNRQAILGTVRLKTEWSAAATSGIAERGEHIWRRYPASSFDQVTVLAADIITADVLATAILSGGKEQLDHATHAFPIDVLTVDRNGSILATPQLREHLTGNRSVTASMDAVG